MLKKKIIYTNHATIRKYERDISDNQILDTIENPDYLLTDSTGRKISRKKINGRLINVIYKDKERYIIIITVY